MTRAIHSLRNSTVSISHQGNEKLTKRAVANGVAAAFRWA
jgi:hypothetical protein